MTYHLQLLLFSCSLCSKWLCALLRPAMLSSAEPAPRRAFLTDVTLSFIVPYCAVKVNVLHN